MMRTRLLMDSYIRPLVMYFMICLNSKIPQNFHTFIFNHIFNHFLLRGRSYTLQSSQCTTRASVSCLFSYSLSVQVCYKHIRHALRLLGIFHTFCIMQNYYYYYILSNVFINFKLRRKFALSNPKYASPGYERTKSHKSEKAEKIVKFSIADWYVFVMQPSILYHENVSRIMNSLKIGSTRRSWLDLSSIISIFF